MEPGLGCQSPSLRSPISWMIWYPCMGRSDSKTRIAPRTSPCPFLLGRRPNPRPRNPPNGDPDGPSPPCPRPCPPNPPRAAIAIRKRPARSSCSPPIIDPSTACGPCISAPFWSPASYDILRYIVVYRLSRFDFRVRGYDRDGCSTGGGVPEVAPSDGGQLRQRDAWWSVYICRDVDVPQRHLGRAQARFLSFTSCVWRRVARPARLQRGRSLRGRLRGWFCLSCRPVWR